MDVRPRAFGPRDASSQTSTLGPMTRLNTLSPLGLLLSLLACAAAPRPEQPLLTEAGAGVRDAEAACRALELLPPDPRALPPRGAEHRVEPARAEWWEATADAFGAQQRAARREVLAAAEAAATAGAPRPVQVGVTDHTFDPDAPLMEAMVTFDLLGLLGTGPAAAQRAVADAELLLALARYEQVLWRGRARVRTARLALAGVRARQRVLEDLRVSAEPGLLRLDLLEQHGRVSSDLAAGGLAMVARLERMLSAARVEEAEALRELALAAGLSADAPELALVGPETLLDQEWGPGGLQASGPAASHPDLRSRALAYALAEARVRAVAARAWPGVALGPHIGAPEGSLDPLQWGGVLRLNLPWPSAWEGELAAAAQRREAAREAYEDAFLALDAEARRAVTRQAQLTQRLEGVTPRLDAGTAAVWEATCAAFMVAQRDARTWIDALERRMAAAASEVEDAVALATAAVEVEVALGPEGPVSEALALGGAR